MSISADGAILTFISPFDSALPPKARALGGRWDGRAKAWVFDARDEQRVRALAREIYGTDGSDADEPTLTIRIDLAGVAGRSGYQSRAVSLLGRQLAWRPSRDEDVRLNSGVVIVDGKFETSGGSARFPACGDLSGIIVEARDWPRSAAERAMAAHPKHVTLVDAAQIDRDALHTERTWLVARIAEIDALLAAHAGLP